MGHMKYASLRVSPEAHDMVLAFAEAMEKIQGRYITATDAIEILLDITLAIAPRIEDIRANSEPSNRGAPRKVYTHDAGIAA